MKKGGQDESRARLIIVERGRANEAGSRGEAESAEFKGEGQTISRPELHVSLHCRISSSIIIYSSSALSVSPRELPLSFFGLICSRGGFGKV